MRDRKTIAIFESFEEENEADRRRRSAMTPEERMRELATLRARQWGDDWASKSIEKVATWETLSW